jgi:hypothetical protein
MQNAKLAKTLILHLHFALDDFTEDIPQHSANAIGRDSPSYRCRLSLRLWLMT